jgi:hypothetical protein
MVLRFPCASRSSRLPSIVPSFAAAVFGWLSCVFLLIGGHLRPQCIFLFFFFCHLIRRPQRIHQRPLPRMSLSAPPLYHLPLPFRQLSVGCCVYRQNGGHLRPRPRPPLCFSIKVTKPPQTSKPTTASTT